MTLPVTVFGSNKLLIKYPAKAQSNIAINPFILMVNFFILLTLVYVGINHGITAKITKDRANTNNSFLSFNVSLLFIVTNLYPTLLGNMNNIASKISLSSFH